MTMALKIMNEARARRPLADMVDSTTALAPLLECRAGGASSGR